MEKIWLVLDTNLYGVTLIGVFSNKELAENIKINYCKFERALEKIEILEVNLDESINEILYNE